MMKTEKYLYEGLTPLDNLKSLAPADDLLFFDIETTGLSRQKNFIYLIGIGYYTEHGMNIIQWLAENESEEILVLKEFLDFSSSFTYVVNYNGKSFDLPFTKERLSKYNLYLPDFTSIDIYNLVKPLKQILSLNDLTQKSIERFLSIKREDIYSGGELIPVYKHYAVAGSNNDLKLLIMHNKEDVLNMHYLTKILDYSHLSSVKLLCDKSEYNEYTDFNGSLKSELIIFASYDGLTVPKGFNTFKNNNTGSFIMTFSDNGEVKLRLPVIEDTYYYYLDNYKDYYYLPGEGICILKSMSGGVLKENRENATKETCRISLSGKFLPLPPGITIEDIRTFRDSCKSKQHFIRIEDFEAMDNNKKSEFINLIYEMFFSK